VFIEASSQSAPRFPPDGASQLRGHPWSGALLRSPAAGETNVSTARPAHPNPNAPALIRPRIAAPPAGALGPRVEALPICHSFLTLDRNGRSVRSDQCCDNRRRRAPAPTPRPPAARAAPAPKRSRRLWGPVRGRILTGLGAGGGGAGTPAATRTAGAVVVVVGAAVVVVVGGAVVVVGGG